MVEILVAGWLFIGMMGVAGRRVNMGPLSALEVIAGVIWGPITLIGELYRALAYQDQDEEDKHWTG